LEVWPGHGSPRLDRVRGRFRNRLSEANHHTVETATRRRPGVLAGGCVLYPPPPRRYSMADEIVLTELVNSRIVGEQEVIPKRGCGKTCQSLRSHASITAHSKPSYRPDRGWLDGLRRVPVNWTFLGRERELTYHDRRGENTGRKRAGAVCAFAYGLFACWRSADGAV
jgi:hypothetical protein